MMQHNRPLVLLCAATLLFLSGMFSLQTVAVYYARDVLGHADLYIVLPLSTVGMVLASALVPKRRAEGVLLIDGLRRRASRPIEGPDSV